eukprot:415588-Pyramimonas_sp.AAC.1
MGSGAACELPVKGHVHSNRNEMRWGPSPARPPVSPVSSETARSGSASAGLTAPEAACERVAFPR